MIDLIESFPDLCCTSPNVRFFGGGHPKYWRFRLSTQAMHSGYAFGLCIRAMHSGYAFRRCIQATHSGYSFKLFIQAIHLSYSLKLSTQIIHLSYPRYPFQLFVQAAFSLCIQTIHPGTEQAARPSAFLKHAGNYAKRCGLMRSSFFLLNDAIILSFW